MSESEVLSAANWRAVALGAIQDLPEDIRAGVVCPEPDGSVLAITVNGKRLTVAFWDTQRDWLQAAMLREPSGSGAEKLLKKIAGSWLEHVPVIAIEAAGNRMGVYPGPAAAAELRRAVQVAVLKEASAAGGSLK